MRRTLFALALVLMTGCQARTESTPAATAAAAAAPSHPLVNRVWARSDSTGLPGVMQIFLSDGTLLMDSCWETYRLEKWRWASDSTVVWHEDTAEIRATVVRLMDDDLVLRLELPGGSQEQHFHVASVPYICPDMKR